MHININHGLLTMLYYTIPMVFYKATNITVAAESPPPPQCGCRSRPVPVAGRGIRGLGPPRGTWGLVFRGFLWGNHGLIEVNHDLIMVNKG